MVRVGVVVVVVLVAEAKSQGEVLQCPEVSSFGVAIVMVVLRFRHCWM